MDQSQPSTSREVCLFCAEVLASKDKSTLTRKGFESLIAAAHDRNDEIAKTIILQSKNGFKKFIIHFHPNCKTDYTNKKNRNSAKKRKLQESLSTPDSPPPQHKRISRAADPYFDWNTHCFICNKEEDKRKSGQTFKLVNMNPASIREKVLSAAAQRSDEVVMKRLTFESDLFAANARYHANCLSSFISPRNIRANQRKQTSSQYSRASERTYNFFANAIEAGQIVLVPTLCKTFREFLIAEGLDADVANSCRTQVIRKKMELQYNSTIAFHSQTGNLPSIMCSKSLSVGQLYQQISDIETTQENEQISDDLVEKQKPETYSDSQIIQRAAFLLKTEVENMVPTQEYPFHGEVSLESSEKFLPPKLKSFMQNLIDPRAISEAHTGYESKEHLRRRYVTLAECIIYSIRREVKRTQIIPPFHIGLMAQLQHEKGSRVLIDTLNSYGICGSYKELRSFVTALANEELAKNEDSTYVPTGIVNRGDGGSIIQEGDDNADINVETIDAKDQYHVMARVIFQNQNSAENTGPGQERARTIKGNEKTLRVEKDTVTKLLVFQKPSAKPEPKKFKEVCHMFSDYIKQQSTNYELTNCIKDLAWVMLRDVSRGFLWGKNKGNSQIIPFWKGFNSCISSSSTTRTVALYIPSIDAKPADPSTVYTTLKNGKDLANKCGQDFSIHTFDQQLYAVAQYVKMSRPEELNTSVLRLGGFHNMCTFISCIGKIWGDGGLKDILCDSGVYGPGAVEHMLNGKQFHRAIRGLTLVYEALMNLVIFSCLKWMDDTNKDKSVLTTIVESLNKAHEAYSKTELSETKELIENLTEELTIVFIPLLSEFRSFGRARSPTFEFWDNFIRAMEILLLNTRAEREGNWDLHLQTQMKMLPYFFTCNKHNYSRWATLYTIDMMTSLPADVKKEFMEGKFPVRFSPNKFCGIWSDLAVEMSAIKDLKGKSSGIIGFTLQESAVLRWTVTRHIMGAYATEMRRRSGVSNDPSPSHDQEKSRLMKRDESDLLKIISHIQIDMADPFEFDTTSDEIINISSGLAAKPEISKSLTCAIDDGVVLFNQFLSERFDSENTNPKSFHDPIKKSSLRTFQDMRKTTRVTIGNKTKQVSLSSEVVYQRALVLAKVRQDVDLEKVLSHPISAIPSSLFKDDGTRRTTKKSELLHELEATVQASRPELPAPSPDMPTAVIIDAMAFLQRMNTKNMKTFNDLGHSFLLRILQLFDFASEVHIVFDRYDDDESPKNEERLLRQATTGHRYHISGQRPIPDWKQVLELNENKANLTNFLSEYIESQSAKIPAGKELFLAGGHINGLHASRVVHRQPPEKIAALFTDQKEADTRMILHAFYIDARYHSANIKGRVVVQTPDTDVFVIFLHYHCRMSSICQIWMETGTVSKLSDLRRFIPLHEIATKIGTHMCNALPAAHALSGCDTVSSFFGIGKKKIWRQLHKMTSEELNQLATFSKNVSEESVRIARSFVIRLYDPTRKFAQYHNSLNALRFKIAVTKTISVANLPPSEVAFEQHVRRAAWQCSTWTNSHVQHPDIPRPCDSGWNRTSPGGFVFPVYFVGPTALEMLQNFFCCCKSKKSCSISSLCACNTNGIGCTDVCRCGAECYNGHNRVDDENDECED